MIKMQFKVYKDTYTYLLNGIMLYPKVRIHYSCLKSLPSFNHTSCLVSIPNFNHAHN